MNILGPMHVPVINKKNTVNRVIKPAQAAVNRIFKAYLKINSPMPGSYIT